MSRSSFSSSLVVVVGGVLWSVSGCGAGASLDAGSSTLGAALESCDALLADADAAAHASEAECAADAACDVDALNARIAQLHADAQLACDALVSQENEPAGAGDDGAGDDGDDGRRDHKVSICHSTGSARNPFVLIHVDRHAIPAHERHHDDSTVTSLRAARSSTANTRRIEAPWANNGSPSPERCGARAAAPRRTGAAGSTGVPSPSTINTVSPTSTTTPGRTTASVMGAPFTRVPWREPRSRTRTPSKCSAKEACRRDRRGSFRVTSTSTLAPMISVPVRSGIRRPRSGPVATTSHNDIASVSPVARSVSSVCP